MIEVKEKLFALHTANTSYVFRVMPTGHLEHLHYGRKIKVNDGLGLFEQHAFCCGNAVAYNQEDTSVALEDVNLEMSSYGKGDIREPFVELIHADGSATCDFLYDSYEVIEGNVELKSLPTSHVTREDASTLKVVLKDASYNMTMELYYTVVEACDIITRRATLINNSNDEVVVTRLLSNSLDLFTSGYEVVSFHGAWGREMNRTVTPLDAGKFSGGSMCGASSSRCNPLMLLKTKEATQDMGEVYGFNLVFSGNHYEAAEVSGFNKTRVVQGISPVGFRFILEPGMELEAPEAVMTYSHKGLNGVSRHFHDFVNNHIVRGKWANKVRPILLNSWEAAYFDFDESKLLNLASKAKDAGIELFVMDDGWFGERNDDKRSLGDWDIVNKKKLPNGVDGLAKKINALGLDFGIWVEPEMVNVDSELYKKHPDWAVQIEGKPHSESRNQRTLDYCNVEVQDHIIKVLSDLLDGANIAYVKWDMNRILSDAYAPSLDAKHQGEFAYRFYEGFYRVLKTLTEKYPEVLFEGCASGGNRFDLGALCYFPQIWASDDTDASCRLDIQDGYSYGYPQSTVSAHVSSCPNHQTLRITPLESRFNVAAFGVLGYECNLCDMKKEDREAIKAQVAIYKEWRELLQFGDFYRSRYGNTVEWTIVAKDKSKAVGMIMQKLVEPNLGNEIFRAKGLDEDKLYYFYNRALKYNIKNFGDLVNTVSPIHVKPDTRFHDLLAKIVKMDGEHEGYEMYGDTLMYAGVKLKQGYAGTGYSDQVRFYQDFGSRIYFMEEK